MTGDTIYSVTEFEFMKSALIEAVSS